MKCFPADIEQKLGFDLVRSRLGSLAGTELGYEAIDRLQPLDSRESVEKRLKLTAEWRLLIESGDDAGLGAIPDLGETLDELGPSGTWVVPEQALEVQDALRTARLVHSFFQSHEEEYPLLHEVSGDIEPVRDLEKTIESLFDEAGELKDDASPELRRIRRQIRSGEDKLRRAAATALSNAQTNRLAAGEEPTIRGGRTVIPIKAEAKRKIDGLVIDSSATGQTVFVEPEACIELNNDLRILEGHERREMIRILEELTDRIREVRSELMTNQEILVRLDVLRSIARLSIELDCVVPEIGEDGNLEIHKGRNPALELVRKRTRGADEETGVVPLTVKFDGKSRILVVSGPNAGGKSVAMKTIGLMALMLAYGIPVPAGEETVIPFFGELYVDIGDEQSIETDLSTFSSHLRRLRRIVEGSGQRSLILIDELGTATEPTAGAAIGQAVIEHLVSVRALGVITTHFGALKAFADQTDGVVNGAMMFDRETLSPTYVFELGVPGSSFAFQIAERASFPPNVLARARELAGSEESNLEDLIAELEATKQRIDAKESELAGKLEKAERARHSAEERLLKLEADRDDILGQAEAKASSLLREANRTIENTIREIREAQAEKERTKKVREDVDALTETIEQRSEQRRKKRKSRKEPVDERRPLAKGDRVVLDDGTAVGEVVEIDGDDVSVTFGSMQTRVNRSRLRKVGGRSSQQVRVGRVDAGASSSTLPQAEQRIDLRGHRVVEAIPKLEKFIDRAIRAGLRRVEILHGTGTGALREGLRDHLASMPDVQGASDAPIEQGGAGISVVDLA